MTHPDVILTVWDDQRNIDTLTRMHAEGKSFAQIAVAIGQGVTRNACIGKAKRLKLPPREDRFAQSRHTATVNGRDGHRGRSGGLGQSKANSIVHRVEGRLKAERARQEGKLSHFGQQPFRGPGRTDVDGDGVDATHLIAFADRRIGKDCSWIPGDALDGAMCCGKPVVEGSEWCPVHHARVYAGASN